jgi:hypothetical protein
MVMRVFNAVNAHPDKVDIWFSVTASKTGIYCMAL